MNRRFTTFKHISIYNCSAEELYTWHSRSGALERLLPPWEKTTILLQRGGIEPGGRVELRMRAGLIPFSSWSHEHFFEDTRDGAMLTDVVDYVLPGHNYLPSWVKKYVTFNLEKLFAHRQRILTEDIVLHQRYSTKPLRILITDIVNASPKVSIFWTIYLGASPTSIIICFPFGNLAARNVNLRHSCS